MNMGMRRENMVYGCYNTTDMGKSSSCKIGRDDVKWRLSKAGLAERQGAFFRSRFIR